MEQRSVLYVSNIEASFRRQAHITRLKNAELQRARSGDEGEASNIEGDVESESSVNDASSSDYAGSNQAPPTAESSDVHSSDLFSDKSTSAGDEGEAGAAALALKRARQNQILGRTRGLRGKGKGPMVGSGMRPEMRELQRKNKRKAEKQATRALKKHRANRIRKAQELQNEAPTKPMALTQEELRLKDQIRYSTEVRKKSQVRLEIEEDGIMDIRDVFRFDIHDFEEPPGDIIVRPSDRLHINNIKTRMQRSPLANTLPWACIVKGLLKPEDFSLKDLARHKYKFYPIGGLNSCRAALELVNGATSTTDPLHLSSWQYQNAFLFADNLTPKEAKYIGQQHNADAEFRKNQTFMEKVKLFRGVIEGRNLEDKKERSEWKQDCLRLTEDAGRTDEGFSAKTINKNSTQFQVARWPDDCFALLEQIEDMHCNYQLKGQKKPTRKSSKAKDNQPKALGSTDVTKLSGLEDAKLFHLLQQIVNGTKTLGAAAADAIIEKVYIRVVDAAKTLSGKNTREETINFFSHQKIKFWARTYKSKFNRDSNQVKWPSAFMLQVNEIIAQKEKEAETRGRKGSRIAAGVQDIFHQIQIPRVFLRAVEKYGEGDEADDEAEGNDEEDDQGRSEAAGDKEVLVKALKEVHNFRGIKEDELPADELTSLNEGDTHLNLIRGCAKTLTCFGDPRIANKLNPVAAKNLAFNLVIIDPPYGLTKEAWDTHSWGRPEFTELLIALNTKNTALGYTIVVFCSATAISAIIKTMHDMCDERSEWTVTVQHAVWYKTDSYDTGTILTCQNILSAIFRRRQSPLSQLNYLHILLQIFMQYFYVSKYFDTYLTQTFVSFHCALSPQNSSWRVCIELLTRIHCHRYLREEGF